MLIKLNDSLDEQLTSYKVSQSLLIDKMCEMELLSQEQLNELRRVSLLVEERKFTVGAKVKWIDGKGEEEGKSKSKLDEDGEETEGSGSGDDDGEYDEDGDDELTDIINRRKESSGTDEDFEPTCETDDNFRKN